MLNVFDSTAAGANPAHASHAECGFLVDPCLLLVLMRVSAVVIVGLANHPIDGWLAHAMAAALAGGLGDNDLLGPPEAIHRLNRETNGMTRC